MNPVDGAVNPVDGAGLRTRVQGVLDDFLAGQSEVLAAIGPEMNDLLDAASELLAGGKRLRAAFCYWGWRGAGQGDDPRIVVVAGALELLQAAALIHDDVMDDSDTRRGRPAVHRRFAELHRSAGWHGDPGRFGLAGAVLLGDLCLSWSDSLLSGCGLPRVSEPAARTVFDQMRTELMAGQYLDVLEQASAVEGDPGAPERARRVIRHKSAKYTIEQPLLLGGVLAGAPEAVLAAYSAYGLPLGEAFQLRDDVLGVFGDPAETGKPAGDDLREGKRTVLVAIASQRATPAQRELLRTRLGDPYLEPDGVAALRQVIVDTGALAEVEGSIALLSQSALAALHGSGIEPAAMAVLADLVTAATTRSR